MNKLGSLKANLKRGHVYRRTDLAKWSNAVDRHIQQLLLEGTLKKVSPGVYYYPKQTAFGDAPPDENTLVRTFLKDDRFLITSPNVYNSLVLVLPNYITSASFIIISDMENSNWVTEVFLFA